MSVLPPGSVMRVEKTPCPDQESLEGFVSNPHDPCLGHVSRHAESCTACFEEIRRLRQEKERRDAESEA